MATSLFSLSLESWKFNVHSPAPWKVLNGFWAAETYLWLWNLISRVCVILFPAQAVGLGTNMHHKGTKTHTQYTDLAPWSEKGQSLLSQTGGVEYSVSLWQPQKLAEGWETCVERARLRETGIGRTGNRASRQVEWLVTEARRLANAGPEGY